MITAENLSFSYTDAPPFVLDRINLEIRAGEYVSVVGDNGCGKSTLVRLILKFLKPTCGSIALKAKRVGYLSQKNDFSNAQFPITVFEMMNSYRRLLKVKDKTVIGSSLGQVGMAEFGSALMGSLSGGQSQKILIARALLGNPDLLVLDEPSTGIDAGSQREIYKILKKLNQGQGMTILSVEHNLGAAVSNSTQIYHMVGGHGHLCSPAQYAEEYLNFSGKDAADA